MSKIFRLQEYYENGHVTYSNLFRIIVMVRDELVVMLPPGENIRPVRQVVRDDWKTISPSLHDRFHVVERILRIQQNVMSKIEKSSTKT